MPASCSSYLPTPAPDLHTRKKNNHQSTQLMPTYLDPVIIQAPKVVVVVGATQPENAFAKPSKTIPYPPTHVPFVPVRKISTSILSARQAINQAINKPPPRPKQPPQALAPPPRKSRSSPPKPLPQPPPNAPSKHRLQGNHCSSHCRHQP